MTTLVLSGLVVFVTHALEAVTGFGCSVLAMPFVSALLGGVKNSGKSHYHTGLATCTVHRDKEFLQD